MSSQPLAMQAIGLATLFSVMAYSYVKLYHRRFKQHPLLPRLPASLVWGHLQVFDSFVKQGKLDRHNDMVFSDIHKQLGRPPLFYLDFWPIQYGIVIVCDPEVAEQLSKVSKKFPCSAPKAPIADRMGDLIGPRTIMCKQGEDWKATRKRFNPGFAPSHLMTLLPFILDKTTRFLEFLDHFAQSEETFTLDDLTTNLTFEIIGAIVMEEDMNAQHLDLSRQSEMAILFKELVKTFADDKFHLPWWLSPVVARRRRHLGNRISQLLKDIIRRRFQNFKTANKASSKLRTVLSLALQDTEHLTPDLLDDTCDQLKSFLFAGHDTTSNLICWSIYELSRTPHALRAVCSELETLFGKEVANNPHLIREKLLSAEGPELMSRMVYISAVIKEVLRLYPPAASTRLAKPGSGLEVSATGNKVCLDGLLIIINHYIIQRDERLFGETANDFVPERWLDIKDKHNDDKFVAGAWRPFETGPRNCIGQELSNIEARVIIAMVACRYDFTKVGLGEPALDDSGRPILDDKHQFKVKSELYPTLQITAKPIDGMRMKIKLR
ncbi:cytochrome P450 [Stachybotrys elegans]|uniref:Cytochrome P450 n=1 Tax=Stachybotrys elegans TaxID=80388 RepID=A0A8K0SP42_9HYPO|nr:cytochrome P450 [Stachybotrys elegans]